MPQGKKNGRQLTRYTEIILENNLNIRRVKFKKSLGYEGN